MEPLIRVHPESNLSTAKEFKLFVVWLFPDDTSVEEFPLIIENVVDPQLTDLMDALSDACPDLKRGSFRLYGRFDSRKYFPVVDYLSMRAAFQLLGVHNRNLLYAVRLSEPEADWPKCYERTRCDINLLLDLFDEDEVYVSLKAAMPEHAPGYKAPLPPPPSKKGSSKGKGKKTGTK